MTEFGHAKLFDGFPGGFSHALAGEVQGNSIQIDKDGIFAIGKLEGRENDTDRFLTIQLNRALHLDVSIIQHHAIEPFLLSHNARLPKFFEFFRRQWTKNCLESLVFCLNQCYIHIVFECSVKFLDYVAGANCHIVFFRVFFFLYSPLFPWFLFRSPNKAAITKTGASFLVPVYSITGSLFGTF